MTDTAARLRALATASLSTVKGRFDLAMEGDAILALLDALDEARRGRDDTRAKERRALREAFDAVRERDAAVALLRKAREALDEASGYVNSPCMSPSMLDECERVVRRIDALLGGGEGV